MLLLSFIPAIIGIVSLALFVPSIRKQMQIFCWPRLEAHFEDGDFQDALPKFGWMAANDRKPANYFRKPYFYYLAGVRHEGYQILPDMSTNESRKRLKRVLDRLEDGKSFQIYVNPKQPKESYVAVGNPVLHWTYALLYGLFFWATMGIYLLSGA